VGEGGLEHAEDAVGGGFGGEGWWEEFARLGEEAPPELGEAGRDAVALVGVEQRKQGEQGLEGEAFDVRFATGR
jgi:hypothetical protein